jgi:phage tail sheath protein FI
MIERSVRAGTEWAVFEPNAEPLWAAVRQSVGAFLHGLFRDGAFQGATPRDAYFVKCDRTTMTQADVNSGRLIGEIGIAPVKPAEFIILRFGHKLGGGEDTTN